MLRICYSASLVHCSPCFASVATSKHAPVGFAVNAGHCPNSFGSLPVSYRQCCVEAYPNRFEIAVDIVADPESVVVVVAAVVAFAVSCYFPC